MGGLNSFSDLKSFTDGLKDAGSMMPVLFIGHGSPMNGIEDNEFTKTWTSMAKQIPIPTAVIVISAHWLTKGTRVTAMDFPKTIHDFGGFPEQLYDVQYPAKGNPLLAKETQHLVKSKTIELDHDWGLDHGAWTIIRHMYPEANIPILQLSIDYSKEMKYHYEFAQELFELRKKGVLILGSGNLVHNLNMLAWDKLYDDNYGYEWTFEINNTFKKLITNHEHEKLINYHTIGKEALLAIPSPDHYIPLLYALGLKCEDDPISFFNDKAIGGSLTMTSVKIG